MPALLSPRPETRTRTKSDQIDFNVIFALAFLIFLLAAMGERLLPGHWIGSQRSTQARKSIVTQALDSARTVVPYAFMG